jgi:hypothetical protein
VEYTIFVNSSDPDEIRRMRELGPSKLIAPDTTLSPIVVFLEENPIT